MPSSPDFVAVAAGYIHNVALKADGTLTVWGTDNDGALGVPSGLTGVIAISAMSSSNLVLKSDGTVVGWGGDQTFVPSGLTGVRAMVAGGAVIKFDGSVISWAKSYTTLLLTPVYAQKATAIAMAGANVMAVIPYLPTVITGEPRTQTAPPGAAVEFAVAVSGVGPFAYAWKKNGVTLADGGNVVGATTAKLSIVGSGVQSADAGAYSLTVTSGGGTVTSQSAALTVADAPVITTRPRTRMLQVGQSASFAVAVSGTAPLTYQWRRNGQLLAGVTGSTLNLTNASLADRGYYQLTVANAQGGRSMAVFYVNVTTVASPGAVRAWGQNAREHANAAANLSDAVVVDARYERNIALRPDGSVRTWTSSIYDNPTLPSSNSDIVAVAQGASHQVSLKSDGSVMAWGSATQGNTSVPATLREVVAIAAGDEHNVALRADGTVVCWGGYNTSGELNVPAEATGVVAIAASGSHSLALRADGTVLTWGSNNDNRFTTPAGLGNVAAVATGLGQSLALLADGTLRTWGANNAGFSNIPAGAGNALAISVGSGLAAALKADGAIVAWSSNTSGELTGLDLINRAAAIATGRSHGLAIVATEAAAIATHPVSQFALAGSNPALTVVPSGLAPFTYQWRKSGVAIAGATASTFTVSNFQSGDATSYDVVVTNALGGYVSALATLSVGTVPQFVTPPTGRIANIGQTISLKIVATGTPAVTYRWKKNGVFLSDGGNISGSETTTLNIANLVAGDAGSYVAVATNSVGTADSAAAALVVVTPPVITSRPATRLAALGNPVSFSVAATDPAPLSYEWRRNGRTIAGATTATLAIGAASLTDSGSYEAIVSNPSGGVAVAVCYLTVFRADTTLGWWGNSNNYYRELETPSGLRGVAAVAVGGRHNLALLGDGTIAPGGDGTYGQYDFPASLFGTTVAIALSDTYSLALKSDGSVTSWGGGAGFVPVPPGLNQIVAITPLAALRAEGTVVSLGGLTAPVGLDRVVQVAAGSGFCLALRDDGTVVGWGDNYWGQTNVPAGLSGVVRIAAGFWTGLALKADGTVVAWGQNASGQATVPTGLSDVVAIYAGPYVSVAARADGTLVQWGVNFPLPTETIVGGALALRLDYAVAVVPISSPSIAQQPADFLAYIGGTASFSVTANGSPPLTYQWFRDGKPVGSGSRLQLTNVQIADAGSYHVVVTSPFGSITSNVVALRGHDPYPVISAQPQPANVPSGQSAGFSVTATGTGPLAYQWRRNGLPLAGATTASLNLGAGTLAQSGVYDVVINDGMSVTISRPASLSVLPTGGFPQVVAADNSFLPAFENTGGYSGGFYRLSGGKVIVIGSFTRLNGTPIRNVARLHVDGSVDTAFVGPQMDGSVYAVVAQADGKLVIGGVFTRVGGQARAGLARLQADGSFDASFAPTANYAGAYALDVQADGKILVGGGFAGAVARVNADGTADASFATSSPNGAVNALVVQVDGKIVLGGSFTGLAGQARSAIARLNTDGTLDMGFSVGTGFNGPVYALRTASSSRLMVGGGFTTYNGSTANRIVRLSAGGAADSSFVSGNGFNSTVYALEVQSDGKILAGGAFGGYGVTQRLAVARLLSEGALDTTFVPLTFQYAVISIGYLNDGSVLVGGGFSSLGTSATQFNIARLAANGASVVAAFAPGLFSPGKINRVVPLAGGKIMVAGAFTHVNGMARAHLARLNADGTLDASFNSGGVGPSAAVNDVLPLPDGGFAIVGAFASYNNTGRPMHARLLPSGALDTAFNPSTSLTGAPIRLGRLADGRLMLAGPAITSSGPSLWNNVMLVNPDGVADWRFAYGAVPTGGAMIDATVLPDSTMLVWGSFSTFLGERRGRLLRLLPTGLIDPTFLADVDDTVRAVALQADGKILIAGDFLVVNNVPRARVARLNADGSIDPTFAPDFTLNGAPSLLLPQADGKVLLGGAFSSVGNNAAISYLARLKANGTVDTSFSAPGLVGAPVDLAMLESGALLFAGGELSLGSASRFGLVRTVSSAGPNILAPPVGGTATAGTTMALAVSIAGGQELTYQWLKDGSPITGATGAAFSVASVQSGDAGSYVARVTHAGGTFDSAAATVSVAASAPVLGATGNAISGFGGAIKTGSRWALTAPEPVAGTAPIAYQWTKDGTAIPGATDRAYLPSTWQTADAGVYRVEFSNPQGVASSAAFTQGVTPALDWDWRLPAPQGNTLVEATFLNGRFLLGGVRGTIVSSADGLSWTVNRLGISTTVHKFAYGNGTYVALSSFGGLWSSADALTWTQRASGTGADGNYFNSLTFGGGRFVAVGGKGVSATSLDGIRWTVAAVRPSDSLGAVAFGGGKFVALGSAGRTYSSSDGVAWIAGATLPRAASYLAAGAGRFVAAGGRYLFISADGVTWTLKTLTTTAAVRSVMFGEAGYLVALDATDGRYWKSADAVTWTEQAMNYALTAAINAFTFGKGTYVAAGSGADSTLVSTNGTAWTRAAAMPVIADVSVAATDGNVLVALGGTSPGFKLAPDGTLTTPVNSGLSYLGSTTDVAFGAGRFVAVGGTGKIVSWVDASGSAGSTIIGVGDMLGVNFCGNRFVAVGTNGTLLTSVDGLSWNTYPSGTTQSLRKTAFGAGVFIAVGANGTVIGSGDTVTWSPRTVTGITSAIGDVIYAGGKFVLVSEGGSIRTSLDGTTWTAQANPLAAGLRSIVYAGGKFYAFTTGNTNYLVSTDAITWTAAQHGNANTTGDAVVLGDRVYLVAANTSIVSLPINVPAPVLAASPESQTFVVGATASLRVTVTGTGPFAYQWFKDGTALIGANFATLALANISVADAGSYTVAVTNSGGTTTSAPAVVTIESRGLLNAAARARVGTGPAALTGVFSVEGAAPKQMLLRAVGPALASIGISGTLVDPQLVVEDLATGATVATNDDWGTAPNAAQIASTAAQVGAAPFAAGSKDAAVLATFAPGTYRVRVVGAGATTGVASLEIYDADATPRLVYLGTRAEVGAGSDSLVQGFALAAVSPSRSYLVRALGPSLGLPGALIDPQLAVFAGATPLASNDNWGGDAAIASLAASVGAMPLPTASKDAALQFTPTAAGVLTVQVSGVGGASGLALLEIFEADAQRTPGVPLAVVSAPENQSINAGRSAVFGVVTVAKPGATYQWSKNGVALAGATQHLLTFPRAQAGDAGAYSVFVTNGGATAFTSTATLSIAAVNNAAHGVLGGGGYTPGGAVTITNTLHFVGSPTSLEWTTTLPAGWTMLADGGAIGDVKPAASASGSLTWRWTTPPAIPVTFTYTVAVPVTETAPRALTASASVTSGGTSQAVTATPTTLTLRPVHTADTDGDGRVGLFELTRVIELYNTRSGTVRTGRYTAQVGTEDGFAPDNIGGAALLHFHAADTNRDGRVALVELTRVIELFNTRSGTARTGAYRASAGSEDGFAPGP